MNKSYLILLLFFGLTTMMVGQGRVNWLTWEQAVEKNAVEKRKILVDVYTDWCGWCKKMEASTFSTEWIADYINENYYPVKFNAEQKEEINHNGKSYKYISNFGRRGYHELAAEIMNGRMSYPTIVFIDENVNVIQPIPGFQDAKTFEMIMVYFAENHYKNVPWQKFTRMFQSHNFPSKRIITPRNPSIQPVGTKGGL